MKKKIIIAVIILVAAAVIVLRTYDGKPKAFLSQEDAITAINDLNDQGDVKEILDVVQLDNHHVYVPFVSNDDQYGMSFWIWERFKWKLGRVEIDNDPHIWKMNKSDPSKQVMVWNIDPKDNISEADYYLLRGRHYSITNNLNFYTPSVQLKHSVSLEEKSYGAMTLPREWQQLIEANSNALYKERGPLSFIFDHDQIEQWYVGWFPHYSGESEGYTSSSYGYSQGDIDLEFIRRMNEYELVLP